MSIRRVRYKTYRWPRVGQNEPPAGTPAALHLAETQHEQDPP